MEQQEVQRFLQAEETAERLIQTLRQLQTEATSYTGAAQALDGVRTRLVDLVQSTEQLTVASHGIIKTLQEMGGPEIMHRLLTLENRSTDEFSAASKRLRGLKTLIIITLGASALAVVMGIIAVLT